LSQENKVFNFVDGELVSVASGTVAVESLVVAVEIVE
jgi:hypothetical protein